MLKTIDLTKVFRTDEVETTALNKVNLQIAAGEFVAIMGPSGCGKSTLLNILGLLDNPSSGLMYFNGEEVSKHKENKRTNLRKSNIGFVFQSFNLIDELTVYENVELPLLYMKVSGSDRGIRAYENSTSAKPFSTTAFRWSAATSSNCPCGSNQTQTDTSR